MADTYGHQYFGTSDDADYAHDGGSDLPPRRNVRHPNHPL
jgi:hypothetical protein